MIYLEEKKKTPKKWCKKNFVACKKEKGNKYKHKQEFVSHWKVDLSSLVPEFFT